jgi:hypothetical protein
MIATRLTKSSPGAEIEDSLHSPIPERVKNWLKNKFQTPIKK